VSRNGTGEAVATYVEWAGPSRSQVRRLLDAVSSAEGDSELAFDLLYHSMDSVTRFGRTAKFDYLSFVSKLGLARIEPGRTYLKGATGPLIGARLLFEDQRSAPAALDARLVPLGLRLAVGFDVLEDALCNWQKSPAVFKPFRG
jgi:hypothetical protein